MSPMDALEFAEDAGQVGIGILGPEYWFTLSHEYQASPDYSQMLNTDNCVRRSIQQATDDIINSASRWRRLGVVRAGNPAL